MQPRAPPGGPAEPVQRAASDTGSWARVEVGLLGPRRAPRQTRELGPGRGSPAGPRARHVGHRELGPRRGSPAAPARATSDMDTGSWARVEVGLLGPRARHVGHGSWARVEARLLGPRAPRRTWELGAV